MLTLLFLGSIGMTEIIVIALIVLLFFGGKKITLEERTEIVRWAEGIVTSLS